MSTTTLSPLAQQLFEAQVQFFTQQTEQQLGALIDLEVNDFFTKAATTTCADWLPQDIALPLANYYLKDIPLSDELAERLHRIAMRVYQHPRLEEVCWGDLLDEKELGELIDLTLSLKSLHLVMRRVARNRLVIDAVSDMMYNAIAGFVSQSTAKAGQMASNIPGAGSVFKLGKSVVGRATSGFEKSAEDNIKRYISSNIKGIVTSSEKRLQKAIDDGRVKNALLSNWKNVKNQPLASLKDYASEEDIHQSISGAITFWHEFRESPYLGNIIDYVSDAIYQHLHKVPLKELLDDAGIDASFASQELNRTLAPVLKHWHQQGWVQAFYERQLLPFWIQADQQAWLPKD